jgi:DNA mismatch repair ATPase MutL
MCNNPEITPMSKIARLTTSTSFQLEAEQVIADLSSAVKELVENSLDSNPRAISNFCLNLIFFDFSIFLDITFINYGFDSIIVEDDGDGISPINMQEIGKKYDSESSNFMF